jgi:hypothetical protein
MMRRIQFRGTTCLYCMLEPAADANSTAFLTAEAVTQKGLRHWEERIGWEQGNARCPRIDRVRCKGGSHGSASSV